MASYENNFYVKSGCFKTQKFLILFVKITLFLEVQITMIEFMKQNGIVIGFYFE